MKPICREPSLLLFEVGLIYTCTFNDSKKSNSQKAILFDLPSQECLDGFLPFKVLLALPGCKEVEWVEGASKQYYFDRRYTEVSIDCSPHRVHNLSNNFQGVRRQYGLQHYIAGTNHSIMGDTLPLLATTITKKDKNFSLWDKGQLLVILSRTKKALGQGLIGDYPIKTAGGTQLNFLLLIQCSQLLF